MSGRKDDNRKPASYLIAHDVVIHDPATAFSEAFYMARLREWWNGASVLPPLWLTTEDYYGIVKVLEFGAAKYAPRNWEEGITYSRVFRAAMDHYNHMGDGEDEETGLPHRFHFLTCYMFLAAYTARGMHAFDDRPRIPKVISETTADANTRIAVAAREGELFREFKVELDNVRWTAWKNGVRAGRNSFDEPIFAVDPHGNRVKV
jgi:hypothetical protein